MPVILDLFCGAGGASQGYADAGWTPIGVDVRPQPRYPFEFHRADALEWLGWGTDMARFDAIHASPPCQAYSAAQRLQNNQHPDLVGEVRRLLVATGLPFVIENVEGAPLQDPYLICGLSLGLKVKRHRLFETNFPLLVPPCTGHDGEWFSIFGHVVLHRRPNRGQPGREKRVHATVAQGREAMGVEWMNRDEMSEAIPPAYTELIGHQLPRP